MGVKVIVFATTLLLNVAVGIGVFFFMLLAMNGFSESDANYGFVTYIVLAVGVSLVMSGLSVVLVHVLVIREFRPAIAGLIAVPIFCVTGVVLKIACSIIGVLVAEYVRVNW